MGNSNEYPLFTVIIPEQNRAEYLGWTLKTCMIQDYPNFEVIVSDDYSDDNSVEVARQMAAKDSRIKVFAHDHHLGMRNNFEFALNQVRPGYVLALGGDDGICAGGIQRMYELIKESGRDLLTWPKTEYFYSDYDGNSGRLQIQRLKNEGIQILRSEDFLNKIAKTFHYLVNECPMFYIKGVVSTKLVERVKARTPDHCFYYCPTPDGFSGVVLAGEVDDYAYVTEPLTLSGITRKSQGVAYMRTDQNSRKQAEEFFNDNVRRTMHNELASQQYSPILALMTADYLLTAKDLPGWPGKFTMFKYEDLIKTCFKMLETMPYENDVLLREMCILREIAKYHGLLGLYDDLYSTAKRMIRHKNQFKGLFLSKRTLILGNEVVGIHNVYEAAMVVPAFYQLVNQLSEISIVTMFKRAVKAIIEKRNYHWESFPKFDFDK